MTVYRNKTVRYSARMHAIVACQMEFRHYPMDIQICPLYIESCKYNNFRSDVYDVVLDFFTLNQLGILFYAKLSSMGILN